MLNWIFGRNLKDALNETRKIRVKGIRFTIRKVNVMNYLDGSNILRQSFDVKKVDATAQEREASFKKQKEYLASVIVAGVVEPKIRFKEEEDSILVDRILEDMELVNELHTRIMEYSYGKKNFRRSLSRAKDLLK